MKEVIRKIAIILVLIMLLMNSSLLVVISEAVEAVEDIIDETKINPVYQIDLEKYVNYSLESGSGVLAQINLKTGIEYKDGQEYKPLNSTGILLNLPKINNEYPENVQIIGNSTKATNGSDTAKSFQYDYNKDNGEIKIATVNEQNEDGNIYTENIVGARDEYTIILNYSSNCFSDKKLERDLKISGFVQANIANDNETRKRANIEQDYTVAENISGLVSTTVETSDIFNGYIYANSKNNTDYRTEYIENVEVNISKTELSDEMSIDTEYNFLNKSDENVVTDEIIYKLTRVDKNKVLSILGENGYFQILNENGEVLGELNKDTEVGENGIYEFKYENELSKVIIKTSKPLNVGTILVQNIKNIKETVKDVDINKIQVKNIIGCLNNIKETRKIIDVETKEEKEVINEYKKEIYKFDDSKIIEIKDSETKFELSVDKTNWTNSMQNDINFTAKLITDNVKYKLPENPVIEIKLPNQVDKVILGDVSLLYGNGLNIVSSQVIEKDGGKFIRIELSGIQSEYFVDSMVEGTNILIPVNIIVKNDIESVKSNISWTYTNDDISENGNEIEIDIESIFMNQQPEVIESPKIMMAANAIDNQVMENSSNSFNQKVESQVVNIDKDALDIKVEAKLGDKILNTDDIVHERQIIKYSIKLTNKSSEKITGVVLEGEVPEGTTYATVDIGTYLLENYEYVKNTEIKKCAIPVSEIGVGETVTVFYEVVVEDLGEGVSEKNISNTITTKVNDNVYNQEVKSNVIKKAELEAYLKSYIGRGRRNSFYYWLDITNLTDKELTNVCIETNQLQKELSLVKAEMYDYDLSDFDIIGGYDPDKIGEEIGEIDENNKYVAKIDKILAKGTRSVILEMKAGNYDDNINECPLTMVMNVNADNTETYISNENRRTAYPEYITVTQTLDKEGENVDIGETVEYKYIIKNESKVKTVVNLLDRYSEYLEDVTVKFDEYQIIVDDPTIRVPSDTIYDLQEEQNVKYERIHREVNVSELKDYNKFNSIMIIPAGKTLEITVTATASEVYETTEVQNYMVVSGDELKTKSTNVSKFYIYVDSEDPDDPDYPDTPEDPDNPDNPDNPDIPDNPDDPYTPNEPDNPNIDNKYSISGFVWIDKNQDGRKQANEKALKDVQVKLYNSNTNNIVTKDNNKQISVTNDEGKYQFNNVPRGNYLVLFEYDSIKYKTTKFIQYGINKDSSNAMSKTVSIDGEERIVGITDIMKVSNSNIENLNMGLIENGKFDLKLDKYVSQITVKNNKTKTYKYNNSKLAKVEIAAKQIQGTEVEIEYKLVVTNEGNVDAYVDEIVDYIPQDLQISNNINGWGKNANGSFINTSLVGQKIGPGESKELTLVAVKKMTSQNTGNILNAAEISISKSVDNLDDIDSISGNRKTDEDDYSEANVIVSIKTGLVRNMIIFVVILGLIAIIIIFVKKVKNKKMFTFIITLVLCTSIFNVIKAEDLRNISGNRQVPFTDQYNNVYYCMDTNKSQCVGGGHTYSMDMEASSRTTIVYNKTTNNIKAKKSKDEIKKIKTQNGYDYYGTYKFTTTGAYNTYDVKITYIPSDANKDESKRTDKNAKIENKQQKEKEGEFDIRVPSGADNIKIEVSITVENAVTINQVDLVTEVWNCIEISGTHGSQCCHLGPQQVQRMTRSYEERNDTSEPKTIKLKFSTEGEDKGNIRVIKTDKLTGEALKPTASSKTKFKIRQVDLDSEEEDKYAEYDKGTDVKFTKEGQEFEIGNNGWTDITNVPSDDRYEYYLEEIEAQNGYALLEGDVEITLSDNGASDITKVKRATNYLFTRGPIKKALVDKSTTDNTFNKNTYKRYVYNLIMGKALNSGNNNDNDIKNIDVELDNNSPTNAQIKKLTYYILDNYVKGEKRLEDIMKEDAYKGEKYFKDIISKLGNVNISSGSLAKARAYMEDYSPNIVQNEKLKGLLQIRKIDADTGKALAGATFRIHGITQGVTGYNVVKTTDGNGVITEEVDFGTYEVEELSAPSGYELKFQEKIKDTIIVTEANKTTDGVPAEAVFKNKMYGDIKITKVDKEFDQALEEIGFRIKLDGKYMQIIKKGNVSDTVLENPVRDKITLNPNNPSVGENYVGYTTSIDAATIFVTNAAGEIEICNLAVGKPYEIIECSIGEGLNKYYYVDGKSYYLDIRPLKNEPLEAYAYTFNTMLDYIESDVNANKEIFDKSLNDNDKEKHVVNLINVFTGYNLYIPEGVREVLNDNSDSEYRDMLVTIENLKRELENAKSRPNNETNIETIRNQLYRERQNVNRKLKDKIMEKYNNDRNINTNTELVEVNGEGVPAFKVIINSCAVTIIDGKINSCEKINSNLVTNNFNPVDSNFRLLKILMEEYNNNSEQEFLNNLIKKGATKYSDILNTEIGQEYENVIQQILNSMYYDNLGNIGDSIVQQLMRRFNNSNNIVSDNSIYWEFTNESKNRIQIVIKEGNNHCEYKFYISKSTDGRVRFGIDIENYTRNIIELISEYNTQQESNRDMTVICNQIVQKLQALDNSIDIDSLCSGNKIKIAITDRDKNCVYEITVNRLEDGMLRCDANIRKSYIDESYNITNKVGYINGNNKYVKRVLNIRTDNTNYEETVVKNVYKIYSTREMKPSEIKYYVKLLLGEKVIRIENLQKWVSLSGYVWQDYLENKDGTVPISNGIFEPGEYKISGIQVALKDTNNNIVVDKDGNQLIKNTDENGAYRFDYIELSRDEKENVNNLSNYYIEFQYDGFTYTSVKLADLEGANTSKAKETEETRTSLNSKFKEVTKGGTVGTDNVALGYDYDEDNGIATYINDKWNYDKDEERLIIGAIKNEDIYNVLATTKEATYVIKRGLYDKQYEIKDINLGVKTREMANGLIYNYDIDNIKVCINGHTNVFKYDQKMVVAKPSELKNGQLIANISSYKRWIAPSYIQSMDDLDDDHELKIYVTYKITLKNASNTLKMSINSLVNYYDNKYSDNIFVGNSIDENKESDNYYGLNNTNGLKAEAVDSEYSDYGYKKAFIKGDNKPVLELEAGQDSNIYIQYQVERNSVKGILDSNQTLNNISEIYSFTTYYGKDTETDTAPEREGQVYAAVDNDSEPANALINIQDDKNIESSKYENDTDVSPSVTLMVGEERNIKGNIFEDLPIESDNFKIDNVNTGEERLGDGIYNQNEKSVRNVLVELISIETEGEDTPKDDNGIAYIYPKHTEESNYDDQYLTSDRDRYLAVTISNNEGAYEFVGIVPGHYKVKFVYGESVIYEDLEISSEIVGENNNNEKVTVENYKSTVRTAGDLINYGDDYWYEYDNKQENVGRYSDALDNYKTRTDINEKLAILNYGKKGLYEGGQIKFGMDSYTETIDIAVKDKEKDVIAYIESDGEETTGTISNIDFGIVERPRQEIDVTKIINNIKLTLANGQVLIDGNPREINSPYLTYPEEENDLLKIEIDNELIQGSTLEVTYGIEVKNLSELDYNEQYYYNYGLVENEDNLVKQTVKKLIDYMDDKLAVRYEDYVYNSNNGDWQELSTGDVRDLYNNNVLFGNDRYQNISWETYNEIKNKTNLLMLENSQNLKDIKPNHSGIVEVTASKILTTANDNYFVNSTEVIEHYNPVGRFTFSTTPGNYSSFENGNENDNDRERLTIIPPTGEMNSLYIIVIGTVALIVLVSGIVLIKKKVLDL